MHCPLSDINHSLLSTFSSLFHHQSIQNILNILNTPILKYFNYFLLLSFRFLKHTIYHPTNSFVLAFLELFWSSYLFPQNGCMRKSNWDMKTTERVTENCMAHPKRKSKAWCEKVEKKTRASLCCLWGLQFSHNHLSR